MKRATKKKSNVLNIADNKRFKEVAVPQTTEEMQLLVPSFGFPADSVLTCRTVFEYADITPGTLIVLNAEKGLTLAAGRYKEEDIYAVVDYVKIDVRKPNE